MFQVARCLLLMLACLTGLSCGDDPEPGAPSALPSSVVPSVRAAAAPPLPPWEEATYAIDVSPPERRAAFYKTRFTDFFRDHGDKNAAWFDDACAFLDRACDYLAYRDFEKYTPPAHVASRSQLIRWLRELEQQGCREPIVHYLGRLSRGFGDREGRLEVLDRQTAYRLWAEAIGQKPRYTLSILALDHVVMRDSAELPDIGSSWIRSWANGNVGPSVLLLKPEVKLTAAEEIEFARVFQFYVRDIDEETARIVLEGMNKHMNHRPWLAHTMRGSLGLQTAWHIRTANPLPHRSLEARMRSQEALLNARDDLDRALILRPDRAEPAVRQIGVAAGLGNRRAGEWFDRAVSLDPHDDAPYREGLWVHRAFWQDDPATMLRIARRAWSTDAYDTGVPDWGRYAIDNLIEDYGQAWWVENHGPVWDELAAHLERRIARPLPRSDPEFYLQEGFKLAHAAGRTEDRWAYYTRLRDMGGRILRPYLMGIDQRRVIDRMYAEREAQLADALARLDQRVAEQGGDELIGLIDEILPLAKHAHASRYLRDLRLMSVWARDYARGERIDLLRAGPAGWWVTRGRWEPSDGPGLAGEYAPEEELRLIAGLRTGTRYRVELRLELPPPFFGEDFGCAGLILDPAMNRSGFEQTWVGLNAQDNAAVLIQDPRNREEDDQYFGTHQPGHRTPFG